MEGLRIGAGDGRLRDLLRKHGPVALGQFISNYPRLTAVCIAFGCAGKKLSLACTTSQCKQSNECEETQFFPLLAYSVLCECACFTSLEKLRAVKVAEKFDQLRDDTSPARLVAGSKARAIVTVEIFVEQDVIFPLRIGLKFLRASVHGPPARPISQKDPG